MSKFLFRKALSLFFAAGVILSFMIADVDAVFAETTGNTATELELKVSDDATESDTKEVIPVKKIKLKKKAIKLRKGKKTRLKYTITPSNATNKKVEWESSDTDVATVSSKGVVKARETGKATITVTTKSGGKTAKCKVTVKKKEVAVKKIKLNKTKETILEGEKLKLKATITPSNATNKKVEWESSDTDVVTVSSKGVVKGITAGTATIIATTKSGGKTAKCKVTVEEEEDDPDEPDDPDDPDEPDDPDDPDDPEPTGDIVYIPQTGKKYHSNPNCSGMRNPRAVTVEEAEGMGYTPCKKCF